MSEVFQRVLGKLICWWSAVSPRLLRLLPNHVLLCGILTAKTRLGMMLRDVADLVTGQAASKAEEHVLLKGYEPASPTSSSHLEGQKQPAHTKWKCLCSGSFPGAWFLSPAARTGAAQAAAPPQGKGREPVCGRTWTSGCWIGRKLPFFHLSIAARSFIATCF